MRLLLRVLCLLCTAALCDSAALCQDATSSDPSLGLVNPRAKQYGAKADGAADDFTALSAAITDARRTHALLYLPAGTYRFSSTLDLTGLNVVGAGRENTILQLSGDVQQPAVISKGRTMLRDLGIHGGWDGHTPNLTGAGLAILSDPTAKPSYTGYEVRLDDVSIQYSKQDCIFIEQGGYDSLHNVKCNASGRHGLMLESDKTPGFATTTVNVDGLSTFSDTGGFAAFIHDGETVSFNGRTVMENTSGIRLTGINGRTLKISGIHQENTRGAKFLTAADSSGIGLTLTDNFFAGTPVAPEPTAELMHWVNITTDSNRLGFYGTGAPIVVRGYVSPDTEPMEEVPGGWVFKPEEATVMGVVAHPPGASWSARLVGQWITGDGGPKAAHEFLLTSGHPDVQVGTTTFHLSLDASGRLQAVVHPSQEKAGPFEFQGVVELVVDRQQGHDGDVAIETAAGVRLSSTRVRALAGKGSAAVCATEDGTLVRCSK